MTKAITSASANTAPAEGEGETMSGELCEEIVTRVRRGEQPDSIEVALLSSRPGLNDDERAALWLFAWLEQEARDSHLQRRHAPEYVHD